MKPLPPIGVPPSAGRRPAPRGPSPARTGGPRGRPARGADRAVTPAADHVSSYWLFGFLSLTLACQLGLVLFGDTKARFPMRVAAYGISLALPLVIRRPMVAHPCYALARWVVVVLCISILHPLRSGMLAAAAQIALYLAILAPIVWVGKLQVSTGAFRVVVLTLWTFYVASAGTAVLQVKFPGRFQGAVSHVFQDTSVYAAGSLRITLADGNVIYRPMGLTDSPGGAAAGGLNAIVLGFGLLFTDQKKGVRFLAVCGMIVGLYCVYLCQVRVTLVMALICAVTFAGSLGRRGDWARLWRFGTILGGVALAATFWALASGGSDLVSRLNTLTAADPRTVFYENRGRFLDNMLTYDLWAYPFGAGLGRWGMINYYFGRGRGALYSELMWTTWLYDGGIPLMLLYSAAFGVAILFAWRIGSARGGTAGMWGSVIFSYNIAVAAATFVFPIFSVQTGLEVWFLNACLFGLWRYEAGERQRAAV